MIVFAPPFRATERFAGARVLLGATGSVPDGARACILPLRVDFDGEEPSDSPREVQQEVR